MSVQLSVFIHTHKTKGEDECIDQWNNRIAQKSHKDFENRSKVTVFTVFQKKGVLPYFPIAIFQNIGDGIKKFE